MRMRKDAVTNNIARTRLIKHGGKRRMKNPVLQFETMSLSTEIQRPAFWLYVD